LDHDGSEGVSDTYSEDMSSGNESVDTEDLVCSEGLKYLRNLNRKGYTVIGIGECKDTRIVIDTYNGLPVTNVSIYAFTHCTDIKEVVLGPNVKEIGESAFHGCTSLETVIMTDSITKIGVDAFGECSSLKTVVLSDAIKNIPERCFYYCKGLSEIHYGGTLEAWEGLEKKKNWDFKTPEYVVKCSDGDFHKPIPDEETDKSQKSEDRDHDDKE
jgi:hypothetical protein